MGFFSDFGKALGGQSTSRSSSKTTMPGWLQDPAKNLIGQASQYAMENQQFPGMTPFQQQALQRQGQLATEGGGVYGDAQTQMRKTINGDNLKGNPYLQQQIDGALGDMSRAYSLTAKPQMEASMVRSGSFGNQGLQQMQMEQQRQLQETMARTAGDMRFNNYGMERQAQINATNNAAQFDQGRYADTDRLYQAGSAEQQQALNELQFPMQQFQSLSNILNPMQQIYAGKSGVQTSITPQSAQEGLSAFMKLINGGGSVPSDRRLKEDIKKVGKTDDGLNVYTYKYKGLPSKTFMGVMAQDVQKRNPDAVESRGGLLAVDYSKVK
jgi:hypothetical protein